MANESKPAATPKKEDETAKKTTTSSSSLGNTLLTILLLVGIGAILGYMLFYSIFNHRCADMMDEAERRFNRTREELNHKLIEAMDVNTANEGAEAELLDLRGRLEGQTDLMGKHQSLLDKHQSTVEQLTQFQAKHSQAQTELMATQKKLAEVEGSLNVISMQKETMEKRLQRSQDSENSAACQAKQQQSLSHIQKLHSAICKEKHGDAPYYVQFDVSMDGETKASSFVVEVATLDQLPNSVFSFLTLVDHDVYMGAEFLSTQSIIHLDSDEDTVATLGYAASALSLVESSSEGRCAPYSVGFVGANGGLKLIMTNDASKHGSLACFGRIAQGRQTVSNIQRAGREGKTVAITGVTTVQLESTPNMREGEL